MQISEAEEEFPGATGCLNTATLGLPPTREVEEVRSALSHWQAGAAEPGDYDRAVAGSRQLFADLVHAPVGWVTVGAQCPHSSGWSPARCHRRAACSA